MKKKTLLEISEIKMEEFNIPHNNNNLGKIKTKIRRELINMQKWENADEKKVGTNKVKIFDENIINRLNKRIEPYMLKMSGIDIAEFQNIQSINKKLSDEKLEGMTTTDMVKELTYEQLHGFDKYDSIDYTPRTLQIYEIMLQALFYEKFELKIDRWQKDNEIISKVDFEDSEHTTNQEYIMASKRLENPLKSYVQKKLNRNNK